MRKTRKKKKGVLFYKLRTAVVPDYARVITFIFFFVHLHAFPVRKMPHLRVNA